MAYPNKGSNPPSALKAGVLNCWAARDTPRNMFIVTTSDITRMKRV